MLFFSYTHSCYVQTLLPSRHGHMNSPCLPHSTSVPTHTDFLTQVTLLPESSPSIPQWAREVRKKRIDGAATLFFPSSTLALLPFLHPSPPLLTLPSPTQITLSGQHSPLFGTHVDTAGQQDKDCYTQQTSQGHHTGYEHREGHWRGEEKAK